MKEISNLKSTVGNDVFYEVTGHVVSTQHNMRALYSATITLEKGTRMRDERMNNFIKHLTSYYPQQPFSQALHIVFKAFMLFRSPAAKAFIVGVDYFASAALGRENQLYHVTLPD